MQLERLVPEHIRKFEAYIPSKPDTELMKLYGCSRLFRLNNNENPLGPPPAAQEVIRRFPPLPGRLYPSGDSYYMRMRLADKFGLHPDQFLVGNGANEVIAFVIKAFCQEGDNIVTADKTFAVYEWVAEFSGFEARLVPLRDFAFDDRRACSRQHRPERTKILFVCNPNNPTGTYWTKERLRRFLDAVAGAPIVVVDEAYCEFVEQEDFPDGMSLLKEYPNLVVFRTFSKMYGLAGLRIGYLAGDLEVVNIIRRTCVVYSVNGRGPGSGPGRVGRPGAHSPHPRDRSGRARAFCAGRRTRLGYPGAGPGGQLRHDPAAHERYPGLPQADEPGRHGAQHDGFSVPQLDTGERWHARGHGGGNRIPPVDPRTGGRGMKIGESVPRSSMGGRR